MHRYGHGHQDSARRQLVCRVRRGNGSTIESRRHLSRANRRADTPTVGFIPLDQDEAALVRMLALGHSFDAIVERVGREPADVLEALRNLAGRVANH